MGKTALWSVGWFQGRVARKLPFWPRWHRPTEGVSMNMAMGVSGELGGSLDL